jgi:hypothetical protein
MAFLNGIEQIRAVDWGRTHDWDLKFENAPAPFNSWFPAADVEEDIAKINLDSFEIYNTTVKIPKSTTSLDLRITFYDDENNTLLYWIRDWINTTILGDGQSVATMDESTRRIFLVKKNSRGVQVKFDAYNVIPEGGITFNGKSEAGIPMYTMGFHIVSSADRPTGTSSTNPIGNQG